MYTRVLVPLDGSARAERALPVAAALARATHGELLLVRIVGVPEAAAAARRQPRAGASAAAVADNLALTYEVDEAVAAEYLRTLGRRLESEGIQFNTDVVTGYPADGIVASARRHKVDLIVICSHGWSGLTHWALGGTAEKILHAAEFPVLILHEGGPLPTEPLGEHESDLRVLVPFDGSDAVRAVIPQAVHLAVALAASRRVELHLFQVVNVAYPGNSPGARPEIGESGAAQAVRSVRKSLTETERRLHRELSEHWNVHVTSSLTAQIDVAAAIIGMAETGTTGVSTTHPAHHSRPGFDLIALSACTSAHATNAAASGALGSIPRRIIYGTKLPVFVSRPLSA